MGIPDLVEPGTFFSATEGTPWIQINGWNLKFGALERCFSFYQGRLLFLGAKRC